MSTPATKGTTTSGSFWPVRGISRRKRLQLSRPGRNRIHAEAIEALESHALDRYEVTGQS